MRALLLTFALVACKGGVSTDTDLLGESDTDADTDADTDTDTDADTDSDTDTDPYSVIDAEVDWNLEDSGSLSPALTATVAAGRVDVVHAQHSIGCCPQFDVDLTHSGSALTASYTLSRDDCDCEVALDLRFSIVGLPAGDWTLTADGEQVGFTLP